jgi:hypothetical protein
MLINHFNMPTFAMWQHFAPPFFGLLVAWSPLTCSPFMTNNDGEVTQLLKALKSGEPSAADRLLPLVYAELHRLASSYMRRERQDHTLQPTALIKEAYLRLAKGNLDRQNREHFIGVAAHVMRRVPVAHPQVERPGLNRPLVCLGTPEAELIRIQLQLNHLPFSR